MPSQMKATFQLAFMLVCINSLIFILLGNAKWFIYQLSISLLLVFCFQQLHLLQRAFSKFLGYFSPNKKSTITSFTLTDSGFCQFSPELGLMLSNKSQISFIGYRLVFDKNTALSPFSFIFRDSLSVQDQARLARVIKRLA